MFRAIIPLLLLDIFNVFRYIFLRVVWTLGPTAQNHMDVLVTTSFDNSGQAMCGHTHESMWIRSRMHSVDRYRHAAGVEKLVKKGTKKKGALYLPSVPFLKPIGKDTPEASSRWS